MTPLVAGPHRLWIEDSGDQGVPLVLLHPGITDSTIWDRLLPMLGDHRVIRYDRPGYGRSPRATVATRPVDDLVDVLDVLQVASAHLIGNSMGGATALALAVTNPRRVASVTALCAAAGGFPWPAEAEDPEAEAEFEALTAAKDLVGLTNLHLRTFAAGEPDTYLHAQVRASTELELDGGDIALADPDTWVDLPVLSVPVAVVAGERDEKAATIGSSALAGHVPGAELLRLDTDHLPQYRDPDAVAGLILRTITRTW